jgi:predicted permease
MKWIQWLIPRSWRETVVGDLDDDRGQGDRSSRWAALEAARVGFRLQLAISGSGLMTDIKYVFRSLWRSRWFTAAAALMLALGIGTNLAVFSIVDRALFRPLPFDDESGLVLVVPYTPETGQRFTAFSRGLFVAARTGVPAIEDIAYVSSFPPSRLAVEGHAGPPLVMSAATYNIFDVLGLRVARGRGFSRADAEARQAIAVLTYETWQARFGGDESVIGRTIGTGERTQTVVGILPAGFIRPVLNHWGRTDGLLLDPDLLEGPGSGSMSPAVARLVPGATAAQAFAQLTALAERLDPELRPAGQPRGPRVTVDVLRAGMFAFSYRYLWLVTIAASLVVCLTAANLSGLLLARGRNRMHDVALRASLGAGRFRLLTTEFGQSLTICLLGATIAVAVLSVVDDKLVELVPAYMRPFVLSGLDARVLWYAFGVVGVTAVVAAGFPAWAASRTNLLVVLQSAAGVASHARAGRLGRWVVAFEAAVGIVLVAGAAIVVRSYAGLALQDIGFSTAGLQEVRIQPSGDRRGGDDAAERARYLYVLEQLRARPEVVMAAAGDSTPGGGSAPMSGALWNGVARSGLWQVTDQWIEILGARVAAGETIRAVDVAEQRPVAVVTRDLARKLWPDLDDAAVLGQRLFAEGQPERRVIGVLEETRRVPGSVLEPKVIVPVGDQNFWFLEFVVKTANGRPVDTAALLTSVRAREQVAEITARPAGTSIESTLQQPRLQTLIFGAFAVIALLVASVGMFALLSFDLAWRRHEFGIRTSLGATRWDLVRQSLSDALRPVGLGAVVGLVAAYWAAGVIESLVVGVDVRDPWTLASVVLVVLLSAAVAAWLPARRASQVDPATVLRSQ